MTRAIWTGLVWGLVAALVFALCLLFAVESGGASVVVGLAAVFGMGGAAGYTATQGMRMRPGRGLAAGTTAGTFGGIVVLVGSLIAVALLTGLVQQRVDLWLQRLARFVTIGIDPAPYLQGGGRLAGGCLGLVNFVLMAVGGGLGGLLRRR